MRQRGLATALALLATLAGTAGAQGKQRLVVTPTTRTIVVGDKDADLEITTRRLY